MRIGCSLVAGSLAAFLACSDPPGPIAEHPSRELLALPIAAADTLRFTKARTGTEPQAWMQFESRAPDVPALVIGAINAPAEQVFGAIRGMVEDRFGRLLVLDAQARIIRAFDGTGRLVNVVGRGGHGPGEFVGPQAMRIGPGDRLYVGDRMGRIGVFDMDPDSIRFDWFHHFVGDLWDICLLGDRLYVHGMQPPGGHPFHVYTLDGDIIDSFGHLYPSRSRIIQYQLSQGRVACLERAGVVLHAPELLPQVHAYNGAGELAWWLDIDGYVPMQVWETATGGSRLQRPDRPWHASVTLVPSAAGDAALLQIVERPGSRPSRTGATERVHTFLISAMDRQAGYVGDGWPRILGWTEDWIFAVREDPYPELLVFEVQGG